MYLYLGIVALIFFFILMIALDKKKPDVINVQHGRASKIEFDGLSYIIWQQNFSDCILHDPDCKCKEKR